MEEKELFGGVNAPQKAEAHNGHAPLPPKITKDNIDPLAGSPKGKVIMWIKAFVYTILSALLIAFAAHSLIVPNDFTIGGASGIAILVNVASNGKVPQSLMVLGLNLPLVVISFFFVKKRFAILSATNIGMQSFWLFLFEQAFKDFRIEFGTGGEKIFAAIAAGLCIGLAVALAFKVGGSTGGADIAAVMIQKKFNAASIAWVLFILNCAIIGCSVFVFNERYDNGKINYGATLLPIMMSAFEAYIESKTNETVTHGYHSAIEFRIITNQPDLMARVLMKELSRGVTATPAKGMYTQEERTMLIVVVSRRQAATVQRLIKQIDPDSFAVMSKASQVLGLGFYTSEMQ
ncbi:MAG: YitT family protein [Clostridia bacterium]|nr:YitT family protein [Clostridia bacterium]